MGRRQWPRTSACATRIRTDPRMPSLGCYPGDRIPNGICSAPIPGWCVSFQVGSVRPTMSRTSVRPETSRSPETKGVGFSSTKRSPHAAARSWVSWNNREPDGVDRVQFEQVQHQLAWRALAHDVRQEVAQFEDGAYVEITRHTDDDGPPAVPYLEGQERIDDVWRQTGRRAQLRIVQRHGAAPHFRMPSKQPLTSVRPGGSTAVQPTGWVSAPATFVVEMEYPDGARSKGKPRSCAVSTRRRKCAP